jgi:serine/threonine-protein kinase RsbW/stage II sporulation protein AB (anti-sigma F factor)
VIASCTPLLNARWPGRPASAPAARHAAVEAARAAGAPPAVCDRVALAVTEAVANAVLHAYYDEAPGDVVLRGWTTPGQVVLEVSDEGRGLLPRDDSPGLGLGLALIRHVADDVRIASSAGRGTAVTLVFALE